MITLGIETDIVWYKKLVTTGVSRDKADRWVAVLDQLLSEQHLSPAEVSKNAGRLSFVVTAATNKVGGAFNKLFYAQK